ncbi:glycosyltransferase [Flavobacteriaceae bacterium MHTCC 0001]
MRVLQLVDSLDTGGTERVAVNIANALAEETMVSALCSTRREGLLKQSLKSNVIYLYLNKKLKIDIRAIVKLYKFVSHNQIEIIHAHSSSFFLAVVLKLLNRKVKVIWHDHYGKSNFLEKRSHKVLKFCSKFFSHILCVNKALEIWAKEVLKTESVVYFPNFAIQYHQKPETQLFGTKGKRIIHLANLRPQKDHIKLLEAFSIVKCKAPEWTLHCVGKDFNDAYANRIKNHTKALNLNSHVFFYGNRHDVTAILNQSDIGVLSSKSEGLPIALLEYGLAELPCVITDVGDCREVISSPDYGVLIEKSTTENLANGLLDLIKNENLRKKTGGFLKEKVLHSFSKETQIRKLINIYAQ